MDHILKIAFSWTLLTLLTNNAFAEGTEGKTIIKLDFEKNSPQNNSEKTAPANSALSNEDFITGKSSLKGYSNAEGKLKFYSLYEVNDIPLKPGSFYKISGTVRPSARVPSKNSHVQLLYSGTEKDNEGKAIWNPPNGISFQHGKSLGKGWFYGEKIIQVPESCAKGTLRIGAYMSKGDYVFFDDVRLIELAPMAEVKTDCLCRDQRLNVTVNVASFSQNPGLKNISGILKFIEKNSGKTVFSQKMENFTSTEAKQNIDISKFPDGQYDVAVEILDKSGKCLNSKNTPLLICRKPSWMNNKIGVIGPDDNAPKPWKNLEYEKSEGGFFGGAVPADEFKALSENIVKTEGIKYTFNPGPMPSQISAVGENILSGPSLIKVQTTLGPLDFSGCKWKLEKAGKCKGVFSFANSDKGLEISGTAEIEFDGMIKYTFTLFPSGSLPVKVKSMSLEFPLTETASAYFTCPTVHTWSKRSEIERQTDSWKINSFHPRLWIGSLDRGLCWFAENAGNWAVSNSYFECARNEKGRTFKVNIIDTPVIIKKDSKLKFVFGISATPTKPKIKNWQGMNFRTPLKKNFEISWSDPNKSLYFGFPIANDKNQKNIKGIVESLHKVPASSGAPGRIIYYVTPEYAAQCMPEYQYFRQIWDIPFPSKDPSVFTPIIGINAADPIWQDFFIYYANELMKKYNYDGLYYDGAGPVKISENNWNIFGVREFFKRLYVMVHQNSPNGLVMMHIGDFVPLSSFGDISLSGEQYRSFLYSSYYPDFMTLKEFRQEHASDFGLVHMLLAQYKGPEREDPKFGAHIMGISLLHNVPVYPGLMSQQVFNDVSSRWVKFGKADAEFIPYWSELSRCNSNNENLKVSYYEKPDGLFAIAMNVSKDKIDSVLEINSEGLKLQEKSYASIYTPATNEEKKIGFNGKINLSLEKYQPIIIEIK